jgi:hypothetical protein
MKLSIIKIILFFQYPLLIDWVSECLLFNVNSAICQLYYGENKLIINDQYAELDFNSTSSLKQQSAGRNVTPFGHIILIPCQPIVALSP